MAADDLLASVLPRLKELVANLPPDGRFDLKLMSVPFFDGVGIFFMLDRGDCYEYVAANAFSTDLDNRQVLAAAIANFERVAADSEATVLQLEADLWMLTGLGGLESSALLAPSYLASLGFDPQQHGCAVPTRDTCLWFAKSNANAVRLAENASRTAYELARASERVAASLLVRSVADGSYSFLPSNDRPRRGWMGRLFGPGAGAI